MPNEETTKIILEFPASSVSIELGTTITFDNISGFLSSDRVTVDGDTLTEKLSAMDSEIAEKADSDDVYDKTYIDNAFTGVNNSLNAKMDKANPTGTGSFAVGAQVVASGSYAHAEGIGAESSGVNSHAEGFYTIANRRSQHVFGEYNIKEYGDITSKGLYVEIVGNGQSWLRSNARTLDWQGNETLAGDLTFNGHTSLTSEISRLDDKIDALPEPMVFKGTLGVGGTIQTLPTASASNEGYTYKVITAGTYAGTTAKVGDVFTSDGSTWVLIPSGDTDTDTWRAIKVNGVEKLGNGISSGSLDVVDTDNIEAEFDDNGNKLKFKTKNIYTQSEVDALIANAVDSVLPTDSVAKSAIATFETDLAKPIDLKAYIEAVQASGTPTPSAPLPISGWSQIEVHHQGANLWNEQWEVGDIDNTTGVDAPSNNYFRSVGYIPVPIGNNLYIYNGNSDTIGLRYYDKDKTFIGARAFLTSKVATYGTNDLPTNTAFIRIVNTSTNVYANNISINYPSSDTEYHAYNPNSQEVTIALGGTYYGGYVEVDKYGHRRLVVTYSELLDMGTLDWKNFDVSNNIFRAIVTNCKEPTTTSDRKNGFLCSIYPPSSSVSVNQNMTDKSMLRFGGYLVIRDTSFSSYTEIASGLSGAKLIYELDTPIIIDLPDGEPITALNGVNNVFCDSGDTEVTYKLSINKALSNLGGGNRSVNLAKSVEEEVKEEVKDEPETRQER